MIPWVEIYRLDCEDLSKQSLGTFFSVYDKKLFIKNLKWLLSQVKKENKDG
jgi:hypothetical protein